MKRFVNGEATEFEIGGAKVDRLGDKLRVSSSHGSGTAVAVKVGDIVHVSYNGRQYKVESKISRTRAGGATATGELRAPMPGQIVDVRVVLNQKVNKGDVMLVLEAMKTQQPFVAPFDGIVDQLLVTVGQQVGDGDLLAHVSAP